MKHSWKEYLGNYSVKEVPPERQFAYRMSILWIVLVGMEWGFVITLLVA